MKNTVLLYQLRKHILHVFVCLFVLKCPWIVSQFQAYKIGMYGPKYVWLVFGFYPKNFWTAHLERIECSKEQMELAVEGTFAIRFADFKNVERGIANVTCKEL